MNDRDTGPVRDSISTGTWTLGVSGDSARGQKGLPGRVTRQPPPQLSRWHACPALVPVPRTSEPWALSLPISTPGATPKVGGQDPLSLANKGPELAGAHGPTWEASRTAEVQGSGAGPGFRDAALCSRKGSNPAATSDDRDRGKDRHASAQACVLMHTRPCTRMDTHAGTQRHKNVVRKGSRQGPSGHGNPGRAGGRCTQEASGARHPNCSHAGPERDGQEASPQNPTSKPRHG